MKSVLVVCFNDLRIDARVKRQIAFLKHEYALSVVCFDADPDPAYTLIKVRKVPLTFFRKAISSFFLLAGLHEIAYRILYDYGAYVNELRQKQFDLIVANDIETLPFVYQLATRATKVFFDAHEFAPRQFEDRLYWRIFFRRFNVYLCRKYIPRVQGMSTINKSLAQAYYDEFGIMPIVTTNAPDYVDYAPQLRLEYPIRLVHHGIFTKSRSPEIMLDMMKLLGDQFTLDLIYLLPESASAGTKQLFEEFKQKASENNRVRVLPPLRSAEIVSTLHVKYDMGIILVPPINFNYLNGLPNKLFDCIQARLAMAVGPLKEIARITNDYKIGVVSEEFTAESMTGVLQGLTLEQLNAFKSNTSLAAREMNAEFNRRILIDTLKKIMSSS